MKLSENWLREWVDPAADAAALAAKLTMAGLECAVEPLAAELPQGVVVARILSLVPHPTADRLRVCEVDAGTGAPLRIVCGAPNARQGMLAPAALPGARLPGGVEIRTAELRGVASSGMLCSASELGLAEKSDGLLELDAGAVPGTPIEQHLGLRDRLLDLDLTPNRGDCLSIAGLAREVGALYALAPTPPPQPAPAVSISRAVPVVVEDAQGCPHYVGRVVSGLDPAARTPDWMRERLRRGGIRAIHPVVDVTNYVLLELGQPMHGFDCTRLKGPIRVRRAAGGERLALLNEQTIELAPQDLLIADDSGPLVLAGVMGGTASGVTAGTTEVFLESACFDPVTVAASGRRHKLLSDSRHRFERGVDPALQRRALERATGLIQQICGGQAGPVVEAGTAPAHAAAVRLRHSQVERLLGYAIPAADIPPLLALLGIATHAVGEGEWLAQVPTHRYDLRIEADLVEEVARIYGYDRIPARAYRAALAPFAAAETRRPADAIKDLLVARGYQEVVTYSFVDPRLQQRLDPGSAAIALDNPIADTMSVMRTSLWSGLLGTWLYNRQRQRQRARLFELGACYTRAGGAVAETRRLGGLVAGTVRPEQWGEAPREADFYDVKADLAALIGGDADGIRYVPARHAALHPGRSARILRGDAELGWLGALHPQLARELDCPETVYLFELDADAAGRCVLPAPAPISGFPSSRRDCSFVVREQVTAESLVEVARAAGGSLLKHAFVFAVYRGAGLPEGCKSVSLGLIFQDYYRTLQDDEVDAVVGEITARVSTQLGASLRG
ncbi:MAG: phenylalanine--tRNA ligase subunit beta [Nevskia sp.]|nr:phenylalanine--tRNA ligase subunit beta [Nevskia sp.]